MKACGSYPAPGFVIKSDISNQPLRYFHDMDEDGEYETTIESSWGQE